MYVCGCIDLCAQVCMFVDVLIFALSVYVRMCVDVVLAIGSQGSNKLKY